MLLEKEAIGEVIDALRDSGAEAFSREAHRHLYEVLIKLYVEDQPIDSVPIKEALTRRGVWEQIGGMDFLAGLMSAAPSHAARPPVRERRVRALPPAAADRRVVAHHGVGDRQ
jgi:replicative DNA helicase